MPRRPGRQLVRLQQRSIEEGARAIGMFWEKADLTLRQPCEALGPPNTVVETVAVAGLPPRNEAATTASETKVKRDPIGTEFPDTVKYWKFAELIRYKYKGRRRHDTAYYKRVNEWAPLHHDSTLLDQHACSTAHPAARSTARHVTFYGSPKHGYWHGTSQCRRSVDGGGCVCNVGWRAAASGPG